MENFYSAKEVEKVLNLSKNKVYALKDDSMVEQYLGHKINFEDDPLRYSKVDIDKLKHFYDKNRETRVICFPAHKGGIGKTTSTGEIGVLLAQQGYKTLLMDFDIDQQNLSFDFAEDKSVDDFGNILQYNGKTIYEWLKGLKLVNECISKTRIENLFILPGHDGILEYAYDDQIIDFIKKELKSLSFYDFIIIDTPPGLGFTTTWALHIATDVFIPIVPSVYSMQGITGSIKNVTTFRKQNTKPEFRGMFITRAKTGTASTKELIDLANSKTLNFLDVIIPERQDVENARQYGLTVAEHKPKLDLVKEYKKIAEVIING